MVGQDQNGANSVYIAGSSGAVIDFGANVE